MTEAWSLYDRMIAQVPDDALVRQVVMGAHHCLVEAECGTGVAALHRGGARLRMERDWVGRPLRELTTCAKSWDFEVASVGVAALNAWHNQYERLVALGLVTDAESTDPFVFLAPVAARMAAEKNDGSRPRVVVIGHFPHLAAIAEQADVAVLERAARADADLPDTACEYLLPDADLIVMTGMTTNQAVFVRPNLIVWIVSAVFTFFTVWISCSRPGRIAGRVSPVEALRYQEGDDMKRTAAPFPQSRSQRETEPG